MIFGVLFQQMLAIWSLVPLPFLNVACTFSRSWFTYCWSLAWRMLSITLLACEICTTVQCFLGLGWKLIFSSPVATAEFSKFAGILSTALSQHHLLWFTPENSVNATQQASPRQLKMSLHTTAPKPFQGVNPENLKVVQSLPNHPICLKKLKTLTSPLLLRKNSHTGRD